MLSILIVFLLINNTIGTSSDNSTESVIERPPTSPDDDVEVLPNYDGALYLSDYIKKGKIHEARKLARVPCNCPDNFIVKSYSGLLTVNRKYQSHLHMWYFKAQRKPKKAPVIFYMDAGPHISTLQAAFSLTSYQINKDLELECVDDQWNSKYHMVFIDSPVGTGFSFTNNSKGYVATATDYGNDLLSAFLQFYQLFPHLKSHNVYLYAHSYGARYALHLGKRILKDTDNGFKLCGVIIANGFIDGLHQSNYGDLLFNLGLINLKNFKRLEELQTKLKTEIEQKDFSCAFNTYVSMMFMPSTANTLIGNLTGFSTPYNFLHTNYDDSYVQRITQYVSRPDVRCALHVRSDQKYEILNQIALNAIGPDLMQSKLSQLHYLLESNITVLLYNGDFDIFTPYTLMADTLRQLDDYGPLYETASRKKWRIIKKVCTDEMAKQWGSCEDNLAGYITEVNKGGKLVHAYIRGGGHFVTYDQDIRTRALLELYVKKS